MLSRCHRIVILSRLLVLFARLKGNDKNFCEVTTQRRNFMMQLLPRQATFSCLLIFPDRHRGCLCSFPNLPLSLQQLTVEVRLRAIRCVRACVDPASVIKTEHSVLPPKGKPEFHAEWLRDKPCDATTTCPRKTGVWCQLLLATARNMRFGGRFNSLGRSGSLGDSSQLTFAPFGAGHCS